MSCFDELNAWGPSAVDWPALQTLPLQMGRVANQPAEAIELYTRWINEVPQFTPFRILLAGAMNDAGQTREARNTLTQLIDEHPDERSPQLLLELARASAPADPVKARMLLRESIQKQPSGQAYELLAHLEEASDKFEDALRSYDGAIAAEPNVARYRYEAALLSLRQNNPKDAVVRLQALLAQHPRHNEAAELLGDTLQELGQYAQALAAYQSIDLRAKNKADALMKIASIQLDHLSQLTAAIQTLRQSIAIEPNNAEAHRRLGYALRDQGTLHAAKVELRTYLRLVPTGSYATEVRGDLRDLER
jgi:predicted Zn-dependent protease